MMESVKERLMRYVDEHKQELFDTLCELVRINTENHGTGGNERPLAELMHAAFERLGMESELYSPDDVPGLLEDPDYLAGRNLADRPNVTARIAGKAPRKALMLAGHLDTVPIGDRSLWTVDPLGGVIKDGKIYGRGANDDKHALAVELFVAKAFRELGVELQNDLYLTGYVDEEFGGGDGALACCVKYPCDFYINVDSDYMDVIHSGVGGQRLAINLRHRELQSSCEAMIEAIYLTKKEIDKFGARRRAEMASDFYYKNSNIPQTALRYMNVVTGLNTNDRHLGTVDFAYYTNQPREQIEREYEELFENIRRAIAPLDISLDSVTYRSRFFCYAATEPTHPCIAILQNSAKTVSKKQLKVTGMCLSDLNIFINRSGGNAVSCGICRDFGVEGGAHLPDEYVICDELVDFTKLMIEFILEWDQA